MKESNNKIHYILVVDGSSYFDMYKLMFHDMISLPSTKLLVENVEESFCEKILIKEKVKKFTRGKCDFFVKNRTTLEVEIEESCKKYKYVCVVFLNAALYYRPYLAGTLKGYKKKYSNLKMVLLYLDIINTGVSKNANYLREANVFDRVYTIDKEDSERISAELMWTPYSQIKEYRNCKIEYDLYFCGASKKRNQILKEILKKCSEEKINCKMDVVSYEESELLLEYTSMVNIKEPDENLLYSQVLKNSLKSECILDIVQKNQNALTIRPFEAVCYNRKLLTNNRTILNFPYYNPNYIQYFENVEDIDWEWLKKENVVDYQYNGEFSPIHFMNDLERSFM